MHSCIIGAYTIIYLYQTKRKQTEITYRPFAGCFPSHRTVDRLLLWSSVTTQKRLCELNSATTYSRLARRPVVCRLKPEMSAVEVSWADGSHQHQQHHDVKCRHPRRHCDVTLHTSCTVWVKKSSPLKLFAVFSLLVNLCNWKLSWLLHKHIPMSTPILVHLSEYLCKMYHFYRCDPSNFKNSV